MDRERFRDWLSHIDGLKASRCKEIATALSEPSEGAVSVAAIELGVDDKRWCGVTGQNLQEGIRRADRHDPFGPAPQGALAGLRHVACQRRDDPCSRLTTAVTSCLPSNEAICADFPVLGRAFADISVRQVAGWQRVSCQQRKESGLGHE